MESATMIKEREICGLSIDVDINAANELYLPEEIANTIKNGDIGDIVQAIYINCHKEFVPISVFMEITDRCNFNCPFCYINEQGIQHHDYPRFTDLKPTLDFLIREGMLYCTLSGGECLLYPDFSMLYRYLKENGVLVTVFTNGYRINRKIINLFNELPPFKIEVSLYGIDDDSYRRTVAKQTVISAKVFDNVKTLKRAGMEMICKTPATSLTEDVLDKIEAWCKSNGIAFNTDYALYPTYSGTSRDEFLASEEKRDKMRKKSDEEFYKSEEMTALANGNMQTKYNFDCNAGRTELFISSNYKIYPCMKAVGIDGWGYDIDELGIVAAYNRNNEKIKEVKGTPIEGCKGCTHHAVCQECYFTKFDYKNVIEHRKNYCKELAAFCEARQ